MAAVEVNGELGAGIDEVWKLVGDFGGFIEALMGSPAKIEGDGIGATRTIGDGPTAIVERLEARDDATKTLSYSIVSGPIPVGNYFSTMALTSAADGRTHLNWKSTFDVTSGTEEAAVTLITNIYNGGIAGLQARFGA